MNLLFALDLRPLLVELLDLVDVAQHVHVVVVAQALRHQVQLHLLDFGDRSDVVRALVRFLDLREDERSLLVLPPLLLPDLRFLNLGEVEARVVGRQLGP